MAPIAPYIVLAAGILLLSCSPFNAPDREPQGEFAELPEALVRGAAVQDESGLVVLEAESANASIDATQRKRWAVVNVPGQSGSGARQAKPISGRVIDADYAGASPRLDFEVNFVRTGVHYVWIRAMPHPGDADDTGSCHIGLDGEAVASAARIQFTSKALAWSNATATGLATVDVRTPGPHRINLWMREDGAVIDKIILTTDAELHVSGSGPSASPLVERKQVFPGSEWETATPGERGIDASALSAAMSYLEAQSGFDGIRQAIVVRDGYVIWHGDDIDSEHSLYSVAKAFTSTVLGLLIDDARVTLGTRADVFVEPLRQMYPSVTLRHFATMTSGYEAIGGDQSPTPFLVTAPAFSPGSAFLYHDAAMNQFANVLTQAAGEPIASLFKRRIADRIGVHPNRWRWGDFGTHKGHTVNGGAGNGAAGITMSARDLARFGHLLLNRGNWDGEQLISVEWVDAASHAQVPATVPVFEPDGVGPGVYGYNWWTNGLLPSGERHWPLAPVNTYMAAGYNGNYCVVIPEWNMVVVRLGMDGSLLERQHWSEFLGKLGAAVRAF